MEMDVYPAVRQKHKMHSTSNRMLLKLRLYFVVHPYCTQANLWKPKLIKEMVMLATIDTASPLSHSPPLRLIYTELA